MLCMLIMCSCAHHQTITMIFIPVINHKLIKESEGKPTSLV